MWRELLVGVAAGLVVTWLALLVALVAVRPRGSLLGESVRLLPDLLRLVRDVAADPVQPRGVRVRLGLLLAYLAMPFDLVPDFLPVIGYADDVVVVVWTLRSVVRTVGLDELRRHWRGTSDGFAALCRVAGLRTIP
ncbi:YkvA family protein [Pedococcus soli]